MIGNGLKWIFLIIGTTIGAGYASGRELWEFFGAESGLAIIIFTVLFIICIYVILKLSYEYKSTHYIPILERLMGKRITKIYDIMLMFYLFSVTVVMIAGGGVTLEAVYTPYWIGVFIICSLLVIMFFWDTKGITAMNAAVIPLLIICLLGVLFAFQKLNDFPITFSLQEQSNWPSSITFTALNILSIIAVLGGIGKEIKTRGEIWIASIGSGLVLGMITFFYNESLVLVASEINLHEMPLFAILKHYPYYMMIVMIFLLWVAIFTTAASGIFGLVTRIRTYVNSPAWLITLVLVIIMAPLTTFGFSNLIAVLYPLYGLLNLYILSAILLYPIAQRSKS